MAAPPRWPYSPDGRFRWDGAAWQPVRTPPPGTPAQQGPTVPPPPGTPAQQGPTVPPPWPAPGHPSTASPWPQTPGAQAAQPYALQQAPPYTHPGVAPRPRRPGTAVFVLVTVGTLIAALVLGGAAGAAVGLATTEPVTDAPAPSFPGRFPTAKQRYLPKVTVDMVAVSWLQAAASWRCARSAASDPLTGATMGMICRPGDAARLQMSVYIWYDGPDKVLSVKARCDLGVRSKACTSLFSMMADTLLSPDRTLRKQAEAWAGKNADKAAVTAIGGVRLETSPRPHSMDAVPAI
ncbi:hypothetical protein IL992_11480 [Microbispora sp. NEAU-D428]|uniref:hypothetical protein n=1 Tax=Microbispora sitophila TaxID=2771537 RepID=UPI00186858C8|nr:hypothetical protein [Microbispora sitophila]MBE3009807.1 hypothetical protein [Microbispora sitophila]